MISSKIMIAAVLALMFLATPVVANEIESTSASGLGDTIDADSADVDNPVRIVKSGCTPINTDPVSVRPACIPSVIIGGVVVVD